MTERWVAAERIRRAVERIRRMGKAGHTLTGSPAYRTDEWYVRHSPRGAVYEELACFHWRKAPRKSGRHRAPTLRYYHAYLPNERHAP